MVTTKQLNELQNECDVLAERLGAVISNNNGFLMEKLAELLKIKGITIGDLTRLLADCSACISLDASKGEDDNE